MSRTPTGWHCLCLPWDGRWEWTWNSCDRILQVTRSPNVFFRRKRSRNCGACPRTCKTKAFFCAGRGRKPTSKREAKDCKFRSRVFTCPSPRESLSTWKLRTAPAGLCGLFVQVRDMRERWWGKAAAGSYAAGSGGHRAASDRRQRSWLSIEEVGSNHIEKFSGTDDLGVLPKPRKMTLVARNQVVRPGSICAFHKDSVSRIRGDVSQSSWNHKPGL